MTADEQIEAIHQAIQSTLGGFATKWVLIADITDDEGSSLRTLQADDMALWDTLGLLRFAQRMTELDVADVYRYEGDQ